MPTPTPNTSSMLRRAARKWGRRLYHWGSVANSTHPTAIVYVVDFTTNTSTNAATTGSTTFHWPNPN